MSEPVEVEIPGRIMARCTGIIRSIRRYITQLGKNMDEVGLTGASIAASVDAVAAAGMELLLKELEESGESLSDVLFYVTVTTLASIEAIIEKYNWEREEEKILRVYEIYSGRGDG